MTRLSKFPDYGVNFETGDIVSFKSGKETVLVGGFCRGYKVYALRTNGIQKTMQGHVLILEAAFGPRPKGMQGCHLNSVRDDNRLVNLKWASASENNGIHKRNAGTIVEGERHHKTFLNEDEVRDIRKKRSEGFTLLSLAKQYNTTETTISRISRRLTWNHVK